MTVHRWHPQEDPASQEPVASLLRAAAAPTEPGPQRGEAAALAEFRATVHSPRRSSMGSSHTSLKVSAAAAATGGILLAGTVAAAAAGTLPGAAQQTAQAMLAKVGMTVPGPNAHSAGHADTRGGSAGQPSGKPSELPGGKPSGMPSQANNTHGAAVSHLARTDPNTGAQKGADISTLASGGKSKAGQHPSGAPSEDPGNSATGKAHKPTTSPGSVKPHRTIEAHPHASTQGSAHGR